MPQRKGIFFSSLVSECTPWNSSGYWQYLYQSKDQEPKDTFLTNQLNLNQMRMCQKLISTWNIVASLPYYQMTQRASKQVGRADTSEITFH